MHASTRLSVFSAVCLSAALLLGGCQRGDQGASPKTAPSASAGATASARAPQPPGSVVPAPGAVDAVIAGGTGFAVGAGMMATRVLYVFFDPQCPHCGRLWETTKPLLGQIRVVWMPVAFMTAKSAPQGAAILSAENPGNAMDAHEVLLSQNRGGMDASATPDPALLAKIKTNTSLWQTLKGESVPFIVFKDPASGQSSTIAGTLESDQLRTVLGLQLTVAGPAAK
jgi:thiol:disulfide interchange protein DsbG